MSQVKFEPDPIDLDADGWPPALVHSNAAREERAKLKREALAERQRRKKIYRKMVDKEKETPLVIERP